MSKLKKIIFIITTILIFPFFMTIFIFYQAQLNLPYHFYSLDSYYFLGSYIEDYLLYGSILIMMLLLIFVIVILFYPKKRKDITFLTDSGSLSISNNALIGLIQSILNQHGIYADKIQVKFKKKRMVIIIYIKLSSNETYLVQKVESLSETILTDFTLCLGIDDVEQLAFKFEKIKEKNHKKRKRVI